MHPMVPLGDEAQMEARFGPFEDSAHKSFWTHTVGLLGHVGHLESRFSPFGDTVSVGSI